MTGTVLLLSLLSRVFIFFDMQVVDPAVQRQQDRVALQVRLQRAQQQLPPQALLPILALPLHLLQQERRAVQQAAVVVVVVR